MITPGDCSPGVSLFSYKSSLCTLGRVQEREFWQLLEEVLGRSYGRSLARDQVLDRLGGMTVVDALSAGEEPRVVWNVLCDQMGIPDSNVGAKIITRLPCRFVEPFSNTTHLFEQMFAYWDIVIHRQQPKRAVSKFFRSRENVDFPRNVGL